MVVQLIQLHVKNIMTEEQGSMEPTKFDQALNFIRIMSNAISLKKKG